LRTALRSASAEVDHLVRIAEDLLVLARSEHGRIPVRREPVSLTQVVDESRRALAATAAASEVTIDVESPDLHAELDGTRVRQALDNLVGNAIRHSPPGGVVRVGVRTASGSVTIEVEDDGPGFDPGELEAVFRPFHRGRGAVHDGSGLGLAIVQAIAEAHDGSVEAANRPGGGARVTLVLATPMLADTVGSPPVAALSR
jgi:two-component system, OmpR family, sensor kinase